MFLHVSVILSTEAGWGWVGLPACITGNMTRGEGGGPASRGEGALHLGRLGGLHLGEGGLHLVGEGGLHPGDWADPLPAPAGTGKAGGTHPTGIFTSFNNILFLFVSPESPVRLLRRIRWYEL